MASEPPSSNLMRYYLAGWKNYQEMLRDHVAARSDEELGAEAAPDLMSARQLVAHIVGVRVGWFHFTLREGSGEDVAFAARFDDRAAPFTSAELAEGLDKSWAFVESCVSRWSEADLDVTFDDEGTLVTRGWVLWHVAEHDLHHGGEYYLTMGTKGIKGPDL